MAESWVTVNSSHRPDAPTDDIRNFKGQSNNLNQSQNQVQGKPRCKQNQVKFMFGDDDSDSGRSYQTSLASPNSSKNVPQKKGSKILSKSPSVTPRNNIDISKLGTKPTANHSNINSNNSSLKDNNGLEILNNKLTIHAPSASTRISNASAQGSPILSNIDQSSSNDNNTDKIPQTGKTKLPLTSQFLLNKQINPQSTSNSTNINSSQQGSSIITPSEAHHRNPSKPSTNGLHTSVKITVPSISRTQAKLLLQRQHSYNEDESSLHHPQNQLKLTKEMEKLNREYNWIRKTHNPILESLHRVMERKRGEMVNEK